VFEVCDRKVVSVIQESLDVAARWIEQNYKTIFPEISKEMIISSAQDDNFNLRSSFSNLKNGGNDI